MAFHKNFILDSSLIETAKAGLKTEHVSILVVGADTHRVHRLVYGYLS